MAMPGVVVPVTINGHTYIDGGTSSPLPVEVLRERSVDHVIAVSTIPNADELKACLLISEAYDGQPPPGALLPPAIDRYVNYFSRGNILDTITRSLHAAESRVAESAARNADVVLRAISCDGRWHDFRNARKYIALGRRAAEAHLAELKKLTRSAA